MAQGGYGRVLLRQGVKLFDHMLGETCNPRPSMLRHSACRRNSGPIKEVDERRLTRAIEPTQPNAISFMNGQGHVVENPRSSSAVRETCLLQRHQSPREPKIRWE